MGNNNSYASLTEDILEEYAMLTYLNKHEILSLFKDFSTLDKNKINTDLYHRIPCEYVALKFPNIQCNAFRERIFEVFSSQKDGCFSFEDMLDFYSVMSHNCPDKVKVRWAFKIFDINNDGIIDERDIMIAIDLLVGNNTISLKDKKEIAKILLEAINIHKNGGINELEFEHAIGKMAEFSQTFAFTI